MSEKINTLTFHVEISVKEHNFFSQKRWKSNQDITPTFP